MTTKPKAAAAKKPPAKKPALAAKKPAPKAAAKKPAGKKKPAAEVVASSAEVFVPPHEIAEIIGSEVITSAPRESEPVVEPEVPASPPPELSDEERELSAIYGDDLTASAPTAHTEYTDGKTADEDRPMMPEINARDERKSHWQERREQRRSRRDRDRGPRPGGQAEGGRPPQPQQGQAHNQPRRDDNRDNRNQSHPQQRLALPHQVEMPELVVIVRIAFDAGVAMPVQRAEFLQRVCVGDA